MEKINDETHKLQVARDATAILHFDLLKPYCVGEVRLWVEWVRTHAAERAGANCRAPTALGCREGGKKILAVEIGGNHHKSAVCLAP